MTLKVAIVGAEKAQKDAALVAVVEKFTDKCIAFANEFGIKHQFTSIEDLVVAIN